MQTPPEGNNNFVLNSYLNPFLNNNAVVTPAVNSNLLTNASNISESNEEKLKYTNMNLNNNLATTANNNITSLNNLNHIFLFLIHLI